VAHVEDRWLKHGQRTARYGQGKRYRVRYLDPAHTERSQSFDRKADAERFRNSTATDVDRGVWTDPGAGRITLAAYAVEYQSRQVSDINTRETVARRLRASILPVLGDRTLAELAARPGIIQSWIAGLPLAPSTVRVVVGTLSAVLASAVADGLIPANPCQSAAVKRPRVPTRRVQPWTAERVTAVRSALPSRFRAIVDLGSGLGLRQGEIFGISPDDIDWLRPGGAVVHVRRQVRQVGGAFVFSPPKDGKERDVPLADPVAMALSAHLAAHPAARVTLPWGTPDGKPVTVALMVTSPAGTAVAKSTFNRVWRTALRRAGVTPSREMGTGCHALRHYFASMLLHGGVDIKAVSEYLGHHSAAFTLSVYVHLMPTADDRAREAISRALLPADGPATAQDGPR
jgi:integrase